MTVVNSTTTVIHRVLLMKLLDTDCYYSSGVP